MTVKLKTKAKTDAAICPSASQTSSVVLRVSDEKDPDIDNQERQRYGKYTITEGFQA